MCRFALIRKEQCLDDFYLFKFPKQIDKNEVYLYEKHPSNLQVQLTTIANRVENLRRPCVERDNLLQRRLKRVVRDMRIVSCVLK